MLLAWNAFLWYALLIAFKSRNEWGAMLQSSQVNPSCFFKATTLLGLTFKSYRMSVFFATLLPWHMSVSFFTAHSPHFCIPTLHFCFGLRHASLHQHPPCIHRSQFSLRQHPMHSLISIFFFSAPLRSHLCIASKCAKWGALLQH